MFAQLALLLGAGLVGPMLAAGRRALVPVVVGELAVGVLLGRTGFHLIDPGAASHPLFFQIGFVMLMLTAGSHVDLGYPSMRRAGWGAARTFLAVAVLAVPVGLGLAQLLHLQRWTLIAVLLSGSSAAVAFPIIQERKLTGASVNQLLAWIAISDAISVILMPLTLTGGSRLLTALIGDLVIILAGLGILALGMALAGSEPVRTLTERSKARGWALQLRLSLVLLLALAAVADQTGASTMVAGFLAGMILVRLGPPDRLALQISGVANGFFVPIFFVLLGARIDLRALVSDLSAIELALAMAVGAVVVHVVAALVAGSCSGSGGRRGRTAMGLAGSAQLGLPAAAAALGLAQHLLSPAVAAALVAGGCLTLAPATFGLVMLAARTRSNRPVRNPAPR